MSVKPIYEILGKRIKGLRKNLGQTQDQMAKQMNISRASLANIEAGRQQVLVHHLFAFARALQLKSPAELLPTTTELSRKDFDVVSLPLSKEGLTKNQQDDIISFFMHNIPDNDKKRENKWTITKKTRSGKK